MGKHGSAALSIGLGRSYSVPRRASRDRPPRLRCVRRSASSGAHAREELLEFYRQMLLIRRFEEARPALRPGPDRRLLPPLYRPGSGRGRHAVRADAGDSVITGYRDHGHMLAYGIDPNGVMAELTGRAAGISKGKGGSMHMFSVEHKFYGGHGIVGAQVSLGTGLALRAQI
jgi:pyruvate dehydrogenase E1 component alpha subunit